MKKRTGIFSKKKKIGTFNYIITLLFQFMNDFQVF